jgi:mandelate racemase
MLDNLSPMVEGVALYPATNSDMLAARFRLLGTDGLLGMALAGLNMAMWDAPAR